MTQTREANEQLDRLIRARYPVVYVVSHEEQRVQRALADIAGEQSKPLYSWTITKGIELVEGDGPEFEDITRDPMAALGIISDHADPAIFILKDFDSLLDNYQVCRALRDLVVDLTPTRKTAIILSPALVDLGKLEKEVVVVDYPLPDAEELVNVLREAAEGLSDTVPVKLNGNGDEEAIVQALRGLSHFEARHVLAQSIVATGELSAEAIPYILGEKKQIVRKSGILEYYDAQATYQDIGGLDLLKAWCKEQEPAFTEKAKEFGVEPPKGLLMVGIPGCGKSLTAKAVAGGKLPLLRLDVGALFQGIVGSSEANTRSALKVAEAIAPCLLWIDEIEKALAGGGGELDGGTSQRVLGTILTWMQERAGETGVFIVATANDITALRPELVERFDEVFFVDLPDEDARVEIITIHLAKRDRNPLKFDIVPIVDATENFSGRVIERVVISAIRRAFADNGREVTTEDLLAIASETRSLAETMPDKVKALRDWARNARPASSKKQKRATRKKTALNLELN